MSRAPLPTPRPATGATRPRLVRRALTSLAAAGTTLLVACSPVVDPSAAGVDEDGGVAVPQISDVEPLADPKSWQGVTEVDLPPAEIEPVAEDPDPQLPATVTDAQGTEVVVEDTSRILALDLYGTLSQTVFELGLGERVVGRDTSSTFPEIADLPVVTQNGHELNAESILQLDPTVVLTDTTLGPWDVMLQLRDAGIPVVVVDSTRNLDNLASLTQEVADALGVPDLGAELGQRIEREATAATDAVRAVAPSDVTGRLRTVFLYVRGQAGIYYMFGEGSGADALIESVGGYDVSAEIGWKGMKPMNDEGLIQAAPDVVLMMTKGLESVGGIDGLLEQFPSLAQTPAGENERVVAMDDSQVLSFGPRTADVVNALGVALYAPDAL